MHPRPRKRAHQKEGKRLLYVTYLLIALSAIAEWVGLFLRGNDALPDWPLRIAKCFDYILTPMAGGALIGQINLKNRWSKSVQLLLIGNALLQIVSVFTDWMIRIDEHNNYTHGPLYIVYTAVYVSVIVIVVVEFALYGRAFQKRNRTSLYAIIALILAGIAAQELLGSEYRLSYIALTIGAILLFIHYSEFSQMVSDDRIREQEKQMSTDALTGLLNRYAYAKRLESYDETADEALCAFSIDVNGLKVANDTLGHAVGDELICGAADCIARTFEDRGTCFRTGGDEFIVFADMDREEAENALKRLKAYAGEWVGEGIKELRLAAGFALAKDHPGVSAEKLVIEADRAMYEDKSVYYGDAGHDRRLK